MGDNKNYRYAYAADIYDAIKEASPNNSFCSVLMYILQGTQSGIHPIDTSANEIGKYTGYSHPAVKTSLAALEKVGIISIGESKKGNKISITLNIEKVYRKDGYTYGKVIEAKEKHRRGQEAEVKKKEKFKNSTAPEFGSPDEVNAVMANDFSQIQKQAQPSSPKPPKNPTYQFDNPDELFEVFAREEWSATDALNVLRENSCLCKLPDERREEFIEVNSHERLAPYYHGKNKPTPEQEASAREAAEILYQTIQTEQQRRIDDESKNF